MARGNEIIEKALGSAIGATRNKQIVGLLAKPIFWGGRFFLTYVFVFSANKLSRGTLDIQGLIRPLRALYGH